MAQLSKSQINFLNSIGVNKEETFDATGYSKSEYRIAMKEFGLKIAYGVTPCKKEGHTLRTRYGSCVQCHPLHMTFQKRNEDGGHIYVAYSIEKGYIKIGSTKNAKTRAKSLREQNYGGFSDWVISYSIEVSELAGQIEFEIHKKLENYQINGDYYKDGKLQKSREMFFYPVEKAIKEIRNYIKEMSA